MDLKKKNNTGRRLLITMAVSVMLMFVWIFLTVWLTGEREIRDFTAADRRVFGVFIAAELATLASLIVSAVCWCKRNTAEAKRFLPNGGEPLSASDKRIRGRSIALFIAAAILAALAEIAGIRQGRSAPAEAKTAMVPLLAAGLLLPFLLLGVNALLYRTTSRHYRKMRQDEMQRWILSHREQAEQVAARKLRSMRAIRLACGVYALLLVLLGLWDAFLIGFCTGGELLTALLFPAVYPLAAGLLRLRFAPPKSYLSDSGCYLEESEYPQLYALCRRAAEVLGYRGKLHVGLTAQINAGIAEIGGEYSVLLGTGLLALFSSDEIYHVLLHEFAHLHAPAVQRENACLFWLENESRCSLFFNLREPLFRWPDAQFSLLMSLYRYAASVGEETQADRAMAEHGDAEIAASALLKLKYADLYAWESESEDRPVPETMEENLHWLTVAGTEPIRRAFRERAAAYNGLIDREILSRSASHPTAKMRLETLGVYELRFSEGRDDPLFRAEADRTAQTMEAYLKTYNSEKDYADYLRQRRELIAAWEAAGRPLQAEEYPDTVAALKEMGRVSDAMALCGRVIDELPGSTYARYMRGCYRLHRWDAAGLEDIYAAMENNHNYVEEGLNQIGTFCCLTGNQQELERYREEALRYAQRRQDEGDALDSLKKEDDLRGETLPPELEESITAYLESIDEGQIDRIYLLHKQISKERYTSAMLLGFAPEAADQLKDETWHKIFLCLDNIPDWQFSLFDLDDYKKIRPDEIKGSLFYLGKKNRQTGGAD